MNVGSRGASPDPCQPTKGAEVRECVVVADRLRVDVGPVVVDALLVAHARKIAR